MSAARLSRPMPQPANSNARATPIPAGPQVLASDAPRPAADLMTPAEAAAQLRVTHKVLERWRSTGEGPTFVKLSSKTIRYRIDDIEAFVTGRVRASTAAA